MGILKRLFGRGGGTEVTRRASPENPAYSLDDPEMWDALMGEDGGAGAAGVRVSPESALKLSPVWRGVFLIANTVGKLPLYVYERAADGEGKRYASTHPAYYLLRRKPNPEVTAFTFKQVVTAQAILMGNGYAWIERAGDGSPREIIPLPPGTCEPARFNGVLYYVYSPPDGGEPRKLAATDVYHIKGPGLDGLRGIRLIKKAKDSLGAGLAAQTYAAKWFGNGAEPRTVFETAEKLTPQQREALKAVWQGMHGGLDNVHKSAILEKGVSIKAFGADPESSQLLETRKFTLMDVANWLQLPLPKIGYDGKTSTYSSLEQESQNFLDDTMEPWLIQHEEQCFDKLLTEEQKRGDTHTVEFMRLALMRADAAARGAFYHNAKLDGWMCDDEIRARENLNPLPDGKGKIFYRPLNMVPVDAPLADPKASPANPKEEPADDAARFASAKAATQRMLIDATRRMLKRLTVHARKAAKAGDVGAFLDGDFAEHRAVVAEAMAPAIEAHAAVCGTAARADVLIDSLMTEFGGGLRAAGDVEAYLKTYETGVAEQFAARVEAKGETP